MSQFVLVDAVNTPLSRTCDFAIHAAGCADLTKGINRQCRKSTVAADSPEAVADAERTELARDFGEDGAEGFAFKIYPCCR